MTSSSFVRCAAIDIGSGMMKFLAFGTESRRVARTVSVPFAHALATAATPNELPPHVLEQGVRQVREFVDLASTVGVPRERVTAICTAPMWWPLMACCRPLIA